MQKSFLNSCLKKLHFSGCKAVHKYILSMIKLSGGTPKQAGICVHMVYKYVIENMTSSSLVCLSLVNRYSWCTIF